MVAEAVGLRNYPYVGTTEDVYTSGKHHTQEGYREMSSTDREPFTSMTSALVAVATYQRLDIKKEEDRVKKVGDYKASSIQTRHPPPNRNLYSVHCIHWY